MSLSIQPGLRCHCQSITINTASTRALLSREYLLFIKSVLGRHCQWNTIYTTRTGGVTINGILFLQPGLGRHCQ